MPEKESICKKCSLENCAECYGKENLNFCTSCVDPYIPFYLNNSSIICEKPCEEGKEEKCLKCDKNKNNWTTCNIGYYLPEDFTSKNKCKKCSVENCNKCYGTIDFDDCESCISPFFPVYENNKITKCEICETGEGEKCLICENNTNRC